MTRALVDVGELPRGSYLGGGDIAAILGVSPYRTAVDVYLSKQPDAPPEAPDTEREKRFRRGKDWEPIVVGWMADDYGIEVIGRNHRYRDPEFPFMAAEIDFEWLTDGVEANGEIKTVYPLAAGRWGEMGTGEVPVEYAAQSLFGLMITDRTLCQYGVVFGADDLTLYHVERDDGEIEWMRGEGVRFWQEHVLKGIPPPPRTAGDLRKLYARDDGSKIDATPEVVALFKSLQVLRERARVTGEGVDAVTFEIGEFMKTHTECLADGVPLFTMKAQTTKYIPDSRLQTLYPDIYRELVCTSDPFRVIRKARKQ